MTHIRRATEVDALGIHDAHMRSIREVCSRHHSPEEINGWGNRPFNEERRRDAIKNHYIWVIEDNGSVEGYGHLQIYEKEGSILAYIHGLYLTSKVINKNNGKKLFLEMLNEAKKMKAITIQLEATLTAHSFYQKLGFYDYAPMKSIEIGGSKVRCYPMRMELDQ